MATARRDDTRCTEAAGGQEPRRLRGGDWRCTVSELVRARVEERMVKLRLGAVAQRLDAILSQAARAEPTYLDFLDRVLAEETEAKQKKRVAMGIQIAHFPAVKTLED